jgi:hypothetical protein
VDLFSPTIHDTLGKAVVARGERGVFDIHGTGLKSYYVVADSEEQAFAAVARHLGYRAVKKNVTPSLAATMQALNPGK